MKLFQWLHTLRGGREEWESRPDTSRIRIICPSTSGRLRYDYCRKSHNDLQSEQTNCKRVKLREGRKIKLREEAGKISVACSLPFTSGSTAVGRTPLVLCVLGKRAYQTLLFQDLFLCLGFKSIRTLMGQTLQVSQGLILNCNTDSDLGNKITPVYLNYYCISLILRCT